MISRRKTPNDQPSWTKCCSTCTISQRSSRSHSIRQRKRGMRATSKGVWVDSKTSFSDSSNRCSGVRPRRSTTGRLTAHGSWTTCTGRPSTAGKLVRSTSWRRTISVSVAVEHVHLERPLDPEGELEVVGDVAAGRELVQEPDALLGVRQGGLAVPGDPPDGRQLGELGRQAGLLDRLGELGHGGVLEHLDERQLDLEGLADAGRQLGHQQRVAAELEEVVVDADALDAQKIAPESRPASAGRACGAECRSSRSSGRLASGAGRARRSTLPVGVRGSASRIVNTEGTM